MWKDNISIIFSRVDDSVLVVCLVGRVCSSSTRPQSKEDIATESSLLCDTAHRFPCTSCLAYCVGAPPASKPLMNINKLKSTRRRNCESCRVMWIVKSVCFFYHKKTCWRLVPALLAAGCWRRHTLRVARQPSDDSVSIFLKKIIQTTFSFISSDATWCSTLWYDS